MLVLSSILFTLLRKMIRIDVILVFLYHLTSVLCITAPLAQLPQGKLRGKYELSRNGVQYETYLGIEYAKVEKRFGISQPIIKSSWNDTKDAIAYGPLCAQPKFATPDKVVGEEDCLFLNVYTRQASSQTKKRPVLFYIHGGGFTYGGGIPFGAQYLIDEDVVLVTMNYRLGVLGFLNLNNAEAAGNMGLKDQLLALKWVGENIEYFGGSKEKISVSGNSAGGASALYLMLNPATKGLINNVIPFSGSPLNPWAFSGDSTAQAHKVANYLNCSTGDTIDVECLKGKSVPELLKAQKSLSEWYVDPIDPFPPTLEIKSSSNLQPFMEVSPGEALIQRKFHPVPVLMLMNRDEGIVLYSALVLRSEEMRSDLDQNFERVAPLTFCFKKDPILGGNEARSKNTAQKLRQFYFGSKTIDALSADNLTHAYTDALFAYGIHVTALQLGKGSKVYTGLFTQVSEECSTTKLFGIDEILGVGHGDEGSYIFNPTIENQPLPLLCSLKSERDIGFSREVVSILADFMENSEPNPSNFPQWKPISSDETESNAVNWFPLEFPCDKSEVLENPFGDRINFWTQLYNNREQKFKGEL